MSGNVPLTALSDCALEQMDSLAQIPPDALEMREIETSHDDAERVIERFGDPDRLLSVRVSLIKHTAFGEGARQLGTRHDSGKHREAEPLIGDYYDLAVLVLGHGRWWLHRRMRQMRHVILGLVHLAGARERGVDVADIAHHFLRLACGLDQLLLVRL